MEKIKPEKLIFSSIFVIIFAGSTFATSSKFIDAEIAAKYYFAIGGLLIYLILFAIKPKIFRSLTLKNKAVLKGVLLIVSIQGIYGILQYFSMINSNHYIFPITGSFENPAGFAAVLSISFPLGLYCFTDAKYIKKYFCLIGLLIIAAGVSLSGSRTGILAILLSTVIFFFFRFNFIVKPKYNRYFQYGSVFFILILISAFFLLYHQNKDSANGRILIWKVSYTMFKDKPIIGHGYGSFRAKYMDYQASYFKNHPNSEFKQLADNVKHPFNEFIKIIVEFGVISFILFMGLSFIVIWKGIKHNDDWSSLVLSGLTAFVIFAFFSYPLQYIAIWVLLGFYLLLLIPHKTIQIKRNKITIISRVFILTACWICLFYTIRHIRAEIRWKEIAHNSLNGNTIKMLPEYEKLYPVLKNNPFFLYNYGAELNYAGKYKKSIRTLKECQKKFNDYDLQLLRADNYYHLGNIETALEIYKHASNMIPCRFWPIYKMFEIYKKKGKVNVAMKFAKEIMNKKVKIPSRTINIIKNEVTEYIKENQAGK